jgi:hypothetical protein
MMGVQIEPRNGFEVCILNEVIEWKEELNIMSKKRERHLRVAFFYNTEFS